MHIQLIIKRIAYTSMYWFTISRTSIARIIATVATAAASWFSVNEEMNRPIATNAAPIRIIPRRLVSISAFTGPM